MNERQKESQVSSSKILIASACCFSLVSILLPFLTVTYYSIIPEDAYVVTYWAYKAAVIYTKLGHEVRSETVLFGTYWFEAGKSYSYPSLADLKVSWIIIATFLAEILTLCLGIVAFLLKGKKFRVLPFISCSSVTLLMLVMMAQIQSQTYCQQKFEHGFWLIVASACLFLLGSIKCTSRG
jgi:hypothetical protein